MADSETDEHFMDSQVTWNENLAKNEIIMNFKLDKELSKGSTCICSEKNYSNIHECKEIDKAKMICTKDITKSESTNCHQENSVNARNYLRKDSQKVNVDHENYCTERKRIEPEHESICIYPDPELMSLPLQLKHEIDDTELSHEIIGSPRDSVIMIVQPNVKTKYLKYESNIKVTNLKQEKDIQPYHEEMDTILQADLLSVKKRHTEKDSQINVETNYVRPRRQHKFKCENCDREFSHMRSLESHSRICSKASKLRKTQCIYPSCSKKFFHKFRMIEHYEKDHTGEEGLELKANSNFINPEYICCNCEHVFTNLSVLHSHEKNCGQSVILKSRSKLGNLKKIMCMHPSCKKQFSKKSNVKHHMKEEHPNMKPLIEAAPNYSCQNCLRTFAYLSSFLTHEKSCGNRSKVKKTPCIHPLCKREFFHKCRLIQHIEEDHPEMEYVEPVKDTSFKCPKCDREYSHERSLKSHTHTCGKRGKLRKTQCLHSACTKEFFHKSRMLQHVRKDHPDIEGPKTDNKHGFKCQNCDTVYGHLQSLQRHMESCGVRGKLKKTKCIHPSCEKRFFHISSMMKHMESDHTDMEVNVIEKHFTSLTEFKLWKEDEEVKSFSYFSTRHSVTSNDGKAYLCFVCQYNGPDRYSDTASDTDRVSLRRWRTGRVKTGIICPARMLVKECHDGSVLVKYVKTHNHEINKNNLLFPPPAQRTFRKYHLCMREANKKAEYNAADGINEKVRIGCEDTLETTHVSVENDLVSGEMIAEAVMGTGYFDYMVKPNCGYVHTLEKANETVRLFQLRTSSRFICYKVQRSFGRDGWCAVNRKILWQQEELRENTLPEFDGVPYILNGTKVMECQYGVNRSAYQKKHRPNLEERKNVPVKEEDPCGHISKKVDCPAKIFLKDVIKFPDFKVSYSKYLVD